MDLAATKGPFTASAQQWMVQPALEYRFCQYFEAYAGTRYNNVHLALNGPLGFNPSGTYEWWVLIIGGRLACPSGKKLSFNVNGDIGGFSVGLYLTWQAYPFFNWQLTKWLSLQADYCFLYTDYQTGSGFNRFKYDMLTSGPQRGSTIPFLRLH